MPLENRDAAYLWDMLQAAKEIEQMMKAPDLASFLDNLMLLRAVERCIEIIGEAARRVSKSYAFDHPEVPWRKIVGQRNILAHEYGQIDYEMLYKTVVDDIPKLIEQLESLLPALEGNE